MLKITLQSPATLRGEINIKEVTFRFYADIKESYPPILHCTYLLLLLSGVSLQAIPYLGMNVHRGRDRKILSSVVEIMEVGDSKKTFHISDGNLSEEGQVEVNAYGSPVAA